MGISAGTLEIQILTNLARLQGEMNQIKRSVGGTLDNIGNSANGFNNRMAGMGKTAGLTRNHMMNLSYQINDLFVSLASGQKPMMVFMQQGSQIAQIGAQAGVGIGAMTKAMLGMIGSVAGAALMNPVFLGIAAAVGVASAALGVMTGEINKNSSVTVIWQDVVLGAFDMARDYVENKLTAAFSYFGTTTGKVWDKVVDITKWAINYIIGAARVAPRVFIAAWAMMPGALGELFVDGVNYAIDAMNWLLKKGVDAANTFIAAINKALPKEWQLPMISAPEIGRLSNAFRGAGAQLGNVMVGAFNDAFNTDYLGNAASALKPYAEERARKRLAKDAKKAGKEAGKAAGDAFVDEFLKAIEDMQGNLQKTLAGLEKSISKDIRDWFKAAAKTDYDDLKDELGQRPRQLDIDNAASEAAAEAMRALTSELQKLANAFDQIGGPLGRTLGDSVALLEGFNSGDFSGVRGPLGALTQILGKDKLEGFAKMLGRTFEDAIGDLGKELKGALEGAGIGMAAGSLILGKNGSGVGSAIGGALGEKLGEKFLSKGFETIAKGLGDFAGPIGSILGGLAGGLIGNLLGGTKRGGATFGGSGSSLGVGGTWGNSDQRIGAASSLAASAIESIEKIAAALGATVTSFTGSISMREGNLRYDPTGRGISKTSKGALDFGQDEAALIKAVLKDAISDGVFDGLSDGVKRILNGGGDIEEQLQKALSFQGVFDELEQLKDPQGYALKQLDAWRTGMDAIFAEAGATAEELAKLEELTGLKRAEILEKYGNSATEDLRKRRELEIQIMTLEGDTVGALAAARQLELSETEESLRPLVERIHLLSDEAEATAKAAELAKQRRGLEIALMEAQGRTAEALAARRADELAAMDESLRALQQAVWTAEDAAEAQKALAQAQAASAAQARDIAKQRRDLEIEIMELSGDAAGALAARRADELAALDPSLRALKERIYALEDEKAAMEASTGVIQSAVDAMLLAGNSAGWLRDKMNAAYDDLFAASGGNPHQFALAVGKLEATLSKEARAILSANALLVENVNEALAAIPNRTVLQYNAVGQQIERSLQTSFAKLTGGATLEQSFARAMAANAANTQYGDLRAPGIAGVRAAREQLEYFSAPAFSSLGWNRQIRFLGDAADGLLETFDTHFQMYGEDVKAFTATLGLLSGQFYSGQISADEMRIQLEALVDMFPDVVEAAQSLELQMTRIERAAQGLVEAGLNSIEHYFGSLSDMAAQLADNGSEASVAVNQVNGAIGRMNSFATVFNESVEAVLDGMAELESLGAAYRPGVTRAGGLENIGAAQAIADAAEQAAGFLITAQAAGIVDALEDSEAFAGVSPELRKTAAMLLEGVSAYDVPSFEAAFIRMSDALAKGTITVDQFNELFGLSRNIFEDTASSFSKLRSDVIDDLKAIIDILDGGIASLTRNSAAMMKADERRALAYLRAIKGVPDLNDTFRDAVSTVSSLTMDNFTNRIDFLRESGQRALLLSDMRDRTADALTEAEQMVNYLGDISDKLQTTNEKLDELKDAFDKQGAASASVATDIRKMRRLAEDQDVNGVPTKEWTP